MSNPAPPTTVYDETVVYDFVTDSALVPKMIGYRQTKGFTVLSVAEQPEAQARLITGLPDNGFPAGPALSVQGKAWVIVSKG